MAKFRLQKNSLIGGELGATAHGRTDLPMYQHSCKLLRNMIPQIAGGAYRRPGSIAQRLATTDIYAPKLIPFVYSKDEVYCVALSQDSGGAAGQMLVVRPNTISSSGLPTIYTPSYPGGATPFRPANYTETGKTQGIDEWQEVQFAQSADILYLVHESRMPGRLYRDGAGSFTYLSLGGSIGAYGSTVTFRDSVPYFAQNTSGTKTIAISNAAVGTGRTLTFAGMTVDSTYVGTIFKSAVLGVYGSCVVTAYVDPTHLTVDVMDAFGGVGAVSTWWESAWSPRKGWPRSIAFYQGRLCYGGTASSPDSIWFSQAANYNQMSVDSIIDPRTSPTTTQPFTVEMTSQQLNKIQWLSAERTLVVGTSGDEFIIDRQSTSDGFARENCMVQVQSHYGSRWVQPSRVDKELIFSRTGGGELQGLAFNEIEQAYAGVPLQTFFDTYPAAERTSGGRQYRAIAWDASRKTIWCCDSVGNLFGVLRDKTQQALAWHSHQMGGFDADDTGGGIGSGADYCYDPIYRAPVGSVASVAVIPNPLTGADDVWLSVKRKSGSTYCYSIERIVGIGLQTETNRFSVPVTAYDNTPDVGLCMTDFSIYVSNYNGGAYGSTVALGSSYIPGTTTGTLISTTGRGIFKCTATQIGATNDAALNDPLPDDIESAYHFAYLGYPYSSYVIPVRPEAGSQIGSAQGAVKRIHEVVVRFFKTMSAFVGKDESSTEEIDFHDASDPSGYSAELYSGDKLVKPDCDYDTDGYLCVRQDDPLPFSVVSISSTGMTYD